jgi:amidase
MNEILKLSGTAQACLIRNGSISSTELVQTHLDRIAAVNPELNAAVEVLDESARADARASDDRKARGELLGPFDGVPFSIKDSIEVQGTVCTAGTLGRRNAPPSAKDATLVSRLRAAGAIPIARTNLPDLLFAFESDNLIHGRTNNPYDVTRTCGGSSGGEAALIAACGSPFGLGSDAAGSVRLPAHYCGIASIKPTSGRLPRTGHVPPPGGWLEMLWQIGPMARHVEDLRTIMPILLGSDARDHTVIEMPGQWGRSPTCLADLRIAYFTNNGIASVTSETATVVNRAARALTDAGARVEERTPPAIDQSYDLEMQLIGPDGGDGLRQFLRDTGSHQTHPLLDGWINKLDAYRTTLAGFGECWGRLDQFRAAMFSFIQNFDAILSPVSASPAVPHGTSVEDANFRGFSQTMTHNLTGWPAAVVRCGESSAGLPIGVQIAAKPWREDVALAIAAHLETALGGWKPPRQ